MPDGSRTAILYVSHLVTPATVWNYLLLQRSVKAGQTLCWVCQGEAARRRLAALRINTFPLTPSLLQRWHPVMNGYGLVPGNCHVPTLSFSRRYPHDYYWFVEYDVRYTGAWTEVFALGRASEADLIAAFVEAPFHDPTWDHWDSIWLPHPKRARSFNPIRRVSHRLLRAVASLLARDYWAHNEALLASTCRHEGWEMQDLNALSRARRGTPIYTPAPNADAPSTLNYRPVQSTVWQAQRHRLYHPVKPLRWFQRRFGALKGVWEAFAHRG